MTDISATSRGAKIELVPWDPASEEHAQRMVEQRLECGWRADEVPMWRELTNKGTKMMYWVVLGDDMPNREEHLAKHLAKYPADAVPLRDTASAYWQRPRPAAARRAAPFVPVGHVALDLRPELDARIGAAPAVEEPGVRQRLVWVASLYVSWALQRGGVGRAVMAAAEAEAAALPLGEGAPPAPGGQQQEERVIVVLDALPEEQQLSPGMLEIYAAAGHPPPALSNEAWYRRQGYEQFLRVANAYRFPDAATGRVVDVDYLYFRKRVA